MQEHKLIVVFGFLISPFFIHGMDQEEKCKLSELTTIPVTETEEKYSFLEDFVRCMVDTPLQTDDPSEEESKKYAPRTTVLQNKNGNEVVLFSITHNPSILNIFNVHPKTLVTKENSSCIKEAFEKLSKTTDDFKIISDSTLLNESSEETTDFIQSLEQFMKRVSITKKTNGKSSTEASLNPSIWITLLKQLKGSFKRSIDQDYITKFVILSMDGYCASTTDIVESLKHMTDTPLINILPFDHVVPAIPEGFSSFSDVNFETPGTLPILFRCKALTSDIKEETTECLFPYIPVQEIFQQLNKKVAKALNPECEMGCSLPKPENSIYDNHAKKFSIDKTNFKKLIPLLVDLSPVEWTAALSIIILDQMNENINSALESEKVATNEKPLLKLRRATNKYCIGHLKELLPKEFDLAKTTQAFNVLISYDLSARSFLLFNQFLKCKNTKKCICFISPGEKEIFLKDLIAMDYSIVQEKELDMGKDIEFINE